MGASSGSVEALRLPLDTYIIRAAVQGQLTEEQEVPDGEQHWREQLKK